MLLSAPTSICKQQIHIQYQPGGWTFSPGHDGNPVQHVQLQYLQIFTDCTSIKCIAPAQGAYTNISIQGSPTKYSRAKLQASQNHTHTQHQHSIIYSQTQINTMLHQKQRHYQLYLWLRSRASILLSEGHWSDSHCLHVKVSLGKNPKLLLMCWSAPSVYECMHELL